MSDIMSDITDIKIANKDDRIDKEEKTEKTDKAAEYTTEITEWEDLNAKIPLLRGIYANGFEKPSPIQKKAILPLFSKRDVIAQAQSGTGKTACFSISALELIDTTKNVTQAMILSPTRELSIQTKKVIDSIGSLFPDLCTQLLIYWMKPMNYCRMGLKTKSTIFSNICHQAYKLPYLVQQCHLN